MKSCQVGAVPFTFIVVSLRAGGEDIVSQTYRIHFNIYIFNMLMCLKDFQM